MKRNFTLIDLIEHPDFIHWAKTGEESSFSWSDWIALSPDNERAAQIAKSVILSIEIEHDDSSSQSLDSLWDNIDEAIDPP